MAHAAEAFVPAADDLAYAQDDGEWLAAVEAGVEFAAVGEVAAVVYGNPLAFFSGFAAAGFDVFNNQIAHDVSLSEGWKGRLPEK